MPIVQSNELTKVYDEFVALDRCSLTVDQGEVFGLLGPNGAGKTTLLRTMLGYLKPTSGSAEIAGHDVASESVSVRRHVAYLPGDARLPRHMRGRGVLKFFAQLHPLGSEQRALDIAQQVELDLNRRVGYMSTGMRQKLALCIVLSTAAPIVILDEPTANLDPSIRRMILQHIEAIRDEGRTVIFSSHVLSEIEQVCNRVVFLKKGRLVLEQTLAELKDRHRIVLTMNSGEFSIPEEFTKQVRCSQKSDEQVVLETDGDLTPLLGWLATMAPRDLRVEPLGISALYEQVHFAPSDEPSATNEVPPAEEASP